MKTPNCISYWFPMLEATGVPVPKTEILHVSCNLGHLLDGKIPEGYREFMEVLGPLVDQVGVPCFLRTGHTSGKHFWKSTCYISDKSELPSHVAELVNFSECCSLIGLPYDVWAVREFLSLDAPFKTKHGMPVAREFRFFVRGGAGTKPGEVKCFHPYWPESALESQKPSDPDWKTKLAELNLLCDSELKELHVMASVAGKPFDGDWSIDFAHTADGRWIAIDMALANQSFHWDGCPNA